jgi:hypothetical protein
LAINSSTRNSPPQQQNEKDIDQSATDIIFVYDWCPKADYFNNDGYCGLFLEQLRFI